MFTKNDLQKFAEIGISENSVLEQMHKFKTGFPYLKIKSEATKGNGIFVLSQTEQNYFEKKYNEFSGTKTKFIPASGAASRMFKTLFEAKDLLENGCDAEKLKSENKAVGKFFANIEKFAFYNSLKALKPLSEYDVLDLLLTKKGLNYGNLPKGLLLFHKYSDFVRTPFEEHLIEAANYAENELSKTVNLHFTVSEEHKYLFEKISDSVISNYSKKYGVKYNIEFSTQKKSTDTIAVDKNNKPFRTENGDLLFRPGGHGALLENLNETDSDIIFIKNIDNVVPETKIAETVKWKKIIAGMLIDCRNKIFEFIAELQNNKFSEEKKLEILTFMKEKMFVNLSQNIDKNTLLDKLNRPIRVCGMVKNEGEPGGGPFIIEENDGTTSLQILESSQINKADVCAMEILAKSTHFNPVDLVCTTKNFAGEKFNLIDFRDNLTGFISEKSQSGKALKALELPGLWNGAMSNWNTVFVEVPITTFNPVKVVNDLLRNEHQV